MYFHSALIALVALAGQTVSVPHNGLPERDVSPLKIELSSTGNTGVKAVITNSGPETMSFLKFNTIFGSDMVRKVRILKDGNDVQFKGVFGYFDVNHLPKQAFVTLDSGAKFETEFDIAKTSDLSKGGSFTVRAEGSVPIAENGNSTKVTRSIRYQSNDLKMNIDGAKAAEVRASVSKTLVKRVRVDSQTCQGRQTQAVQGGIRNCVRYAQAAAEMAGNGDPKKFQEFFKTTDQRTRQEVSRRFSDIARECGSATSGRSTLYCQDVYRQCQQGLIAYTTFANSHVVTCPGFYQLPPVANRGYDPDHGYVIVHELCHAPHVHAPYTVDHAYGYESCRRLNMQQSLGNADNYSLFAAAAARGGF